jgi:hypothetical protein
VDGDDLRQHEEGGPTSACSCSSILM